MTGQTDNLIDLNYHAVKTLISLMRFDNILGSIDMCDIAKANVAIFNVGHLY